MKKVLLSIIFASAALIASSSESSSQGITYIYEQITGGARLTGMTVSEPFDGKVDLPAYLGNDIPLIELAKFSIAEKKITEIMIPSSVKKICESAFSKTYNITNIVFACDKPNLENGWTGELDNTKCVISIHPSASGWGRLPGTINDMGREFNIVSLSFNADYIVTITPESGEFPDAQPFEAKLTQEVVTPEAGLRICIYYTTDGSDPTEESRVYSSVNPIIIDTTSTIKAYLCVYQSDNNGEEFLIFSGPIAKAMYTFPRQDGGPYTEEVSGKDWTYTVKNEEAIIERASFKNPAVPVETEGDLMIPKELGMRPVAGIGVSAFERCRYLTKVTFPETISKIESFAFKDCLRLKELDYQGGNPEVDLAAFDGCPLKVEPLEPIKVKVALPIEIQADDEGNIELPENWLDLMAEIHGGETWKTQFTERFGEGTTDTLKKETGKVDCMGNSLQVWQEYVAGTDPLDAESKLLASVELTEDGPVITWTPDLSEKGRIYTIYGMKNLTDKQKATDVTAMTPGERKSAGYRFFFMSVRLATEEVSE